MYFDISERTRRVQDGSCSPVSSTEFLSWVEMTNTIVYPWEYAILCKMDLTFCHEMNVEIEAYQERQKDKAGKR